MSAAAAPAAAGIVYQVGSNEYLDLQAIAELLGVKHGSAQMYHRRAQRNRREDAVKSGDMPEPDMRFGLTPVWERKAIEAWIAQRPGRGAGGGAAAWASRRAKEGGSD